jgi:hypothetical protein
VSDQTSIVSLYFYSDKTASLSGVSALNLRWDLLEAGRIVKIDVLDKKVVVHFKIEKDAIGPRGTLEWAGFDTMVFRKRK